MDFESNYEILKTADFIRGKKFTRVALQFPDELLKDSTRVAKALRSELGRSVRLFVMADTAYGCCCVDEVGASHIDAECLIHYGHACMSPTTSLPVFYVFGKGSINVTDCVQTLNRCLSTKCKRILILFGLEYAHALQDIKTAMAMTLPCTPSSPMIQYAEVACSRVNSPCDSDEKNGHDTNAFAASHSVNHEYLNSIDTGTRYNLGGLKWSVPVNHKIEDYLLVWIGSDDSAFANVVLTFNSCEIVRYDAVKGLLLENFSHHTKTLKRRYYLVEKAKDANIVGILVGTLAVAGYHRIINQMKELIEKAGKKSYILVMGRPNAAKLANFPECDVFVYVSCAQTALLDSKNFLTPVITPYEALLAFSRGKEWTGEYVLDFSNLMVSSMGDVDHVEEARFSFIKGGYIEDAQANEPENHENEDPLALVAPTEKALNMTSRSSDSILFKGSARSGADFFAARSFQGLKMQHENPPLPSFIIGRSGRAAGYDDEKTQEKRSCASSGPAKC